MMRKALGDVEDQQGPPVQGVSIRLKVCLRVQTQYASKQTSSTSGMSRGWAGWATAHPQILSSWRDSEVQPHQGLAWQRQKKRATGSLGWQPQGFQAGAQEQRRVTGTEQVAATLHECSAACPRLGPLTEGGRPGPQEMMATGDWALAVRAVRAMGAC